MTKKLGVLSDPWRKQAVAPPPAAAPAPVTQDASPVNEDIQDEQHATLELKGYGGVTVDGVSDPTQAAAQILAFCVDHLKQVDDLLVSYGVVVAQVPREQRRTQFYVQRLDGWMLAVPHATTRDEGCLQLIQAMLALYRMPEVAPKLKAYRIRPFKM